MPEDIHAKAASSYGSAFSIPTLEEMGYPPASTLTVKYPGGETAALQRLEHYICKDVWIRQFEKPNTAPNSLEPSTTVLSPYLKFGCLSVRRFYHALLGVYAKGAHAKPPVSLEGQLLWREFFYLCGYAVDNFDHMKDNRICRSIPWTDDAALLAAWSEGRTGYPFIDAIMRQLITEGWIHHLARHAVACFLTRGDLWQSWEAGVRVFDKYLLDADWSLNNANWMWLSCSSFFYQYFRCYSPVAFGKKTDKTGAYIRKYVPEVRRFSDKHIYEPWTASAAEQKQAGCIIGKDYPKPIVDHDKVSKENMSRMKLAYDAVHALAAKPAPSAPVSKKKSAAAAAAVGTAAAAAAAAALAASAASSSSSSKYFSSSPSASASKSSSSSSSARTKRKAKNEHGDKEGEAVGDDYDEDE